MLIPQLSSQPKQFSKSDSPARASVLDLFDEFELDKLAPAGAVAIASSCRAVSTISKFDLDPIFLILSLFFR